MFPDPLIARTFAFRSAWLWLGARGVMALVLANAHLPPFPRTAGNGFLIVVITTALCFAELARRRERVLIGNLGVSFSMVAGISIVPPALAEALVIIGSRLFL